jgi:putative flippase GtrA
MSSTDSPTPPAAAPSVPLRLSLGDQLRLVIQQGKTLTLSEFWRWLLSPSAPFIVQFGKYGFCGGLAFIAHSGVVLLLSKTVNPAMDGLGLPDAVRSQRLLVNNLIAFPIGNLVAYCTNALFVFKGGRHSRWREFALFTAVSGVSMIIGLLVGPALINSFGVSTVVAQFSIAVTSALVNFACRKFFVFAA